MQDKIGFMMNNLTSANVEEKAKELRDLLTEEYWSWFCTYIVIKRAAQEPNFQHLYESLITGLQVCHCLMHLNTRDTFQSDDQIHSDCFTYNLGSDSCKGCLK